MKRVFVIWILLAYVAVGYGQTLGISNVVATAEDYVLLLETKGYRTFAYDVTSLKDETYWIEPVIQHYQNGKLVPNMFDIPVQFSSRDMLASENDEYVERMRKTGQIYDEQNGILSLCEKIRVGFAPSNDQCVRIMRFYVTNRGNVTLPLFFDKQIDLKTGMEEEVYSYGFVPFVVDEIVLDKFIPLVMCGAYWYDENSESFRFCGEEVLTEEMTENILKMVKDYYVIGMKVHR